MQPAASVALQEDRNKLQKWSDIRQVKFNTKKYHTMRITLRHNTINADYHLGGCTLSMATQYPHLGVTIYNTMSWQNHINNITSRANSTGLIKRGTSQKLNNITSRANSTGLIKRGTSQKLNNITSRQGSMQDKIIASHTCFGRYMDVKC